MTVKKLIKELQKIEKKHGSRKIAVNLDSFKNVNVLFGLINNYTIETNVLDLNTNKIITVLGLFR